MPTLKDKLREIETETCYQSCREYIPELIDITKILKKNKDNASLKDVALTIEGLVFRYKITSTTQKKIEQKLSKEIIDWIKNGKYNYKNFILDVYHSNIDNKLLYNEFKKCGRPLSYRAIAAWATRKLDKYEKQALESREPVGIKMNGREIYVDCRRGIHINHEEAVEANKGYLEEFNKTIRNP